ncbi:hypothetical protein B0H14DRAFT_2559480 [Mycena olivaceomarginata]|nr:hypothetical protein B0H14DRAFT_2559480 [Mycena olivaceomarginata]
MIAHLLLLLWLGSEASGFVVRWQWPDSLCTATHVYRPFRPEIQCCSLHRAPAYIMAWLTVLNPLHARSVHHQTIPDAAFYRDCSPYSAAAIYNTPLGATDIAQPNEEHELCKYHFYQLSTPVPPASICLRNPEPDPSSCKRSMSDRTTASPKRTYGLNPKMAQTPVTQNHKFSSCCPRHVGFIGKVSQLDWRSYNVQEPVATLRGK